MKAFNCREIEIKGTNLIEASAGTGKTYSIALLFLRMVLEGIKADSILAVTFTNAATAELKSRVITFLKNAKSILENTDTGEISNDISAIVEQYEMSSGRDTVRDRLACASRDIDNAQIFTIHGFCRRMIADNAFETGVLFNMEIAPDIDETVRSAVESFWRREIQKIPEDKLAELSTSQWFSIERLIELVRGRRNVADLIIFPECGDDSVSWEHKKSIFDSRSESRELCSDLTVLFKRLLKDVNGAVAFRAETTGMTGFDDLLKVLYSALGDPVKREILTASMKKKYTAVLIDEFQDTDSLQYRIFNTLFGNGQHILFFIGDPKQAIYSFRNADVFAYLNAKKSVDDERKFTMDVNYRSSKRAVKAVTAVFDREFPFIIKNIPFLHVKSSSDEENSLFFKDAPAPGMEIKFIGSSQALPFELSGGRNWKNRRIKHEYAKLRAVSDMCASVIEMLKTGSQFRIVEKNQKREMRPSDIAVLVNSNNDAELVKTEFSKYGIPFVMASNASVFESDEAVDMITVLEAVSNYSPGRIKAALLTGFFRHSVKDILELTQDASGMEQWYSFFSNLNDSWEKHGFLVAFSELLEKEGIYERISSGRGGERRLTNVRHLMELAHRHEKENGISPEASLRWFREKMNEKSSSEDEQQRLESDENAVTITTVHKSKGLTYPVVFCPDLWRKSEIARNSAFLYYHNEDGFPVINFDINDPGGRESHISELGSENLRLAYVAMTRARYLTVVYWGSIYGAETAPFARLFHNGIDSQTFKTADDDRLMRDLVKLADSSEGAVSVSDRISVPDGMLEMKKEQVAAKGFQKLPEKITPEWRTGSFSSLTSNHQVDDPSIETVHDNISAEEEDILPEGILAFPAGAKSGVALHSVFENIDFTSRDNSGIISEILESANIRSFSDGTDMTPWVLKCVNEVLDATVFDGYSLRDTVKKDRVTEMEFFFHSKDFDTLKISKLLKDRVSLSPNSFKGFIRGFMDLVFRINGKYYLLDWKSNRLGSKISDYGTESMEREMKKHNYVLQYMLYLSALDRYLRQRDPKYSYERDFGGVYYIFIRGVSAANGYSTGIYKDKPSTLLLNEFNYITE